MPKITPNITEQAKQIYDNLPSNIKRGEFVSEAIIKLSGKGEPFTAEQIKWLDKYYVRRNENEMP
jgi:hypothetical protein